MGGGNLHVGPAVGDFLAQLVIDAAGHEFGEGADEGNLAGDGEARGGTHHIGLGDAALDESFGELGREGIHLQGAFEVCRQGYYAAVGLSGPQEALTETAAGVFLTCIDIFFHNLSFLKDPSSLRSSG